MTPSQAIDFAASRWENSLTMASHNYVLIMAGGSGTRLYPRSRENFPKQLQSIFGKTSLLQQTFARAVKVVTVENIYISTNHRYVGEILRQLPRIKEHQLITEPVKRNTAPAMALATAIINKVDPEAVIASLHSDHLVLRPHLFILALKLGFETVKKNHDYILAIGVEPTSPHPGYGYIERGEVYSGKNSQAVYRVKRFVEKPDRKTAQTYVDSGNFYWNCGYFIWQGKHFLAEFFRLLPDISVGVEKIRASYGTAKYDTVLQKEFAYFPDMAVDPAVMEKTKNMLVLPANLGWSDVGSWDTVTDLIEEKKKDKHGNYSEGLHVGIDTYNTVVLSHDPKKLVATIGLNNLTIVTTKDAILITVQGRGQEVKQVVEELKKRKLNNLL